MRRLGTVLAPAMASALAVLASGLVAPAAAADSWQVPQSS